MTDNIFLAAEDKWEASKRIGNVMPHRLLKVQGAEHSSARMGALFTIMCSG